MNITDSKHQKASRSMSTVDVAATQLRLRKVQTPEASAPDAREDTFVLGSKSPVSAEKNAAASASSPNKPEPSALTVAGKAAIRTLKMSAIAIGPLMALTSGIPAPDGRHKDKLNYFRETARTICKEEGITCPAVVSMVQLVPTTQFHPLSGVLMLAKTDLDSWTDDTQNWVFLHELGHAVDYRQRSFIDRVKMLYSGGFGHEGEFRADIFANNRTDNCTSVASLEEAQVKLAQHWTNALLNRSEKSLVNQTTHPAIPLRIAQFDCQTNKLDDLD